MTSQDEAFRIRVGESTSIGRIVSAECRRSGDWRPAAAWLAEQLNEIDSPSRRTRQDSSARSIRSDVIDQRVRLVDGDWREIDVVVLDDGTRVCWHLGASRATTRWIVEGFGEACSGGSYR